MCIGRLLWGVMALTELWLKGQNGKIRDRVEEFADRDAMSVRISIKGKIVFQLRYRYLGKACRLDIGTYPNLSLKDARSESERLKAFLEKGIDPKTIKHQETLDNLGALTVSALFYEWYEKDCKPNKASHHDIKRSFEIHLLPSLGQYLCDNLKAHHWIGLLETVAKTTPEIAKRLLSNARLCLSWGVKRELIATNPLQGISAKNDLYIKKNIKSRVLTDDEISLILYANERTRSALQNKLLIILLLIYGCRVGELRLAKKSDFDFEKGVWTVPASNHKMGHKTNKPLLRPIVDDIKPYLLELFAVNNSEFLFCTKDGNIVGENYHLSLPKNIDNYLNKKHNIHLQHWSVHDLRRTMRTHLSGITTPHIAEIMLGHALPTILATYDKHDYLDEQAIAYKDWVKKIERLKLGVPSMIENANK